MVDDACHPTVGLVMTLRRQIKELEYENEMLREHIKFGHFQPIGECTTDMCGKQEYYNASLQGT